MKKVNLTSLALKKSSVSNLTSNELTGGTSHWPTFAESCTCQIDTENCSTVDVWRKCNPCD